MTRGESLSRSHTQRSSRVDLAARNWSEAVTIEGNVDDLEAAWVEVHASRRVTGAAAITAAILFLGMAGFQVALALGVPLGQHVLGGRNSGTLPNRLRLASAVAAVILVGAAIVVLARAAVIGFPVEAAGLLVPACWVIAGYMALNTLGNVKSTSRLERTVFAAMTAVLAVLCGYVALS